MRDFCTGCGACINICNSDAIKLIQDKFGFYKAEKDETLCTNCGLCEKVCPLKEEKTNNNEPLKYYEASCKKNSSSGGMFFELAKYVLYRNGYIFCAAFNNDFTVKHIAINSEDDLFRLKKLKYIQSYISEYCLKDVKSLLDKGFWVLYTGTTCQIDGLNNFLGKKYERLITADIICQGVTGIKIYEKIIKDGVHKNEFYEAFGNSYLAGEHCDNCKYCSLKRISDFTLSDFTENNKEGTVVFINNEKAMTIFNEMKSDFNICKEIPKEKAIQNQRSLKTPVIPNKARDYIYKNIDNMTFKDCYYKSKEKYSIGILNLWNTNNKGAVLTNYALCELIKEQGYIPLTINFIHPREKFFNPNISRNFACKYFNLTKLCKSKKDLKTLNNDISNFICGSDQIFREEFTNIMGRIYNFDWLDDNKKIISYAGSFGTNSFNASPKNTTLVKHYLSRFDFLSVREFDGVDIMNNTFDLEAQQVLDPVFCINKEKYNKILNGNNKNKKDKYIFCYGLWTNNNSFNDLIKNICNQKNTDRVIYANKNDSVETWLSNIMNAEFVITDSFHGCAFSIIYNIPFIAIVQDYPGSSRFKTLAELFPEIKDNIIFNPENAFDYNENVDWEKINQTIESEKIRSINWLKNAIESPKKTILSKEQKMYDAILNKCEEDNEELKNEIERLKYENKILSYTLKIPKLKREKRWLKLINIITFGIFNNKILKKTENINYILNEYEAFTNNNS